MLGAGLWLSQSVLHLLRSVKEYMTILVSILLHTDVQSSPCNM